MPSKPVNESGVSKPRHKRASFVCQKCHRLKMKCDITTHGIPCSRCEKRGDDSCELFLSKKRSSFDTAKTLMSISNGGLQQPDEAETPGVNRQPIAVDEEMSPRENGDSFEPLAQQANQTAVRERAELGGYDNNAFPQSENNGNSHHRPEIEEVPRASSALSLGSPFSRFGQLEWLPSFAPSPMDSQMGGGSFNNFNYNNNYNFELGAMPSNRRGSMYLSVYRKDREGIEFTFDLVRSHSAKVNRQRLTFLGESCPLSLLLRRLQDSGHVYMTAASAEEETEATSLDAGVANSGSLDWPPSSDAASSPSCESTASRIQKGSLQELLRVYFHVIHPFYPIINRRWFAERYASQTVPPVLMNAVCFAACYHCDSSAIHNAGFSYRQDAKKAFYEDAKRLFDDDVEPDLVVVLQAAFLLSFHGGKPRRVWNNRAWVSVAVNIAEDLGMHRSTMRSSVDKFDKSHLRIIWWCMVMRDIMASITLGRPHKICELRCDVDPLMVEDFELVDKDPDDTDLFGKSDPDYYRLLVEVCKANMLMWKVFSSRYDPRSDPRYNPAEYRDELAAWRRELPEIVDWAKRPNSVPAIYMAMIHHHLMIYISRPRMIDSEVLEVCSLEESVQSANEIVSQVIKLASTELLAIPQDVYPLFVTAMAILIADYRSNQAVVSKLQLQICIMTLNQARESWDHASWLKSLFERMLEENTTSPPPNPGGLLDSLIAV
ncbi:hypothetical protein TRVA0_067S00232 [Trichomonascus vanleenenianus]|uniref:uncharacterized protein n=1 Tax=Trichomonascus vanleenenianus TaxID=2268995 RepID=UPI003ECB5B45